MTLEGRSNLRIEDEEGRVRVSSGTFDGGAPYLILEYPDGDDAILADVVSAGGARLVIRDATGRSEIRLTATSSGPRIHATFDGDTVWTTDR